MSRIEMANKAREYKELQVFIRQLEEEAEAIKQQIISVMDSDTVQADVYTIKYTEYQSSRLDSKALKAELPDLAERYTGTTTARRFQIA